MSARLDAPARAMPGHARYTLAPGLPTAPALLPTLPQSDLQLSDTYPLTR